MTTQLPSKERLETLIRAIECESYDEEEIVSWVNSDEILSMASTLLAAYEQEPVAVVELSDYVTAAQLSGDEPRKKAAKELYEGALVVGQVLYTNPAPSIHAVPDECPKCDGTGMMDSGGVQPWGEPIQVVCDCRYEIPDTTVPEGVSGPLEYAYKKLTPQFMRNYLDVFERYGIYPGQEVVIPALRIALDGMERRAAMLNGGKS